MADGRATPYRVCRHCGREGVRGYIAVLLMDGTDAGHICKNAGACFRRLREKWTRK